MIPSATAVTLGIGNTVTKPTSTAVYNNTTTSTNNQPTQEAAANVSLSPEAQWANIASRYDVKHITPEETVAMANELLKEGLIDGGTNAMLTISAHLAMDANRYAQEHHLSEQYSYLNLPEMFQGGAEFYQSMAKFDEAKDMEKIAELTKNLSNLRSQLFA